MREQFAAWQAHGGGYPKFFKEFNFVEFPDYYNTELGNGIYTQIIEFEKSGTWKLKVGDGEVEFNVKDISNSKNVGDIAPKSFNSTISEKNIEQLTTGLPPINEKFYIHKINDLLNENKKLYLYSSSLLYSYFFKDIHK